MPDGLQPALLGRSTELGVSRPVATPTSCYGDPATDTGLLGGQDERLDLIARGGELVVNRPA